MRAPRLVIVLDIKDSADFPSAAAAAATAAAAVAVCYFCLIYYSCKRKIARLIDAGFDYGQICLLACWPCYIRERKRMMMMMKTKMAWMIRNDNDSGCSIQQNMRRFKSELDPKAGMRAKDDNRQDGEEEEDDDNDGKDDLDSDEKLTAKLSGHQRHCRSSSRNLQNFPFIGLKKVNRSTDRWPCQPGHEISRFKQRLKP